MPWGNSKAGVYNSNYTSGYGQLGPLGQVMQGNDLSCVPDVTGAGQAYPAGMTMRGTTAYYAWYPNNSAYWANQAPAQTASPQNPMTLSITPVSPPQGTPYPNAAGLGHKFNMKLLATGGRLHDSQVASDGSMYFVGANQAGDKFTAGDFDATATGYRPYVGKVAADAVTLSGPAKQPSGDSTRDYFYDIAINEGNGQVFAVGFSYQGLPTFWDPDGSGPLPAHAYTNPLGIGTGVLYDSSWGIVKAVVWDTNNSGEGIYDVASTPDNGWILVGTTTGTLKSGATNPAIGTSDIYIAKYDNTGTLVWDYQSETTQSDSGGDVKVDPADGSIYVSANRNNGTDNDPILMKFTSAGSLVWTTTIDNAGSADTVVDHGIIDKRKVYLLMVNNPSIGGVWTSTTGYVPLGTNENHLQKLIPGDFNTDKFVNFADVQIAGAATKPGLPGVDTYDFDGDGDSTLADTTFMITSIMDRLVGDIAQDSLVTDVDNADIGKAIGASGVGTLYLDGDLDWDGDVDATDITAVAGAFTGAKTPGKWTNGTPGATLRYRASDGQVWIHASQAAGGIVTSFQLENAAGTFVPASYTGPTGGSFGGTLEDDTTHVLGDTDLTLAGAGGTVSLGTVFPTGMDLAGLTAYLTTAVYTGQPGSGQMLFNLVVGDLATPYGTWAATNAPTGNPDDDYDGDGVSNAVEFVLGGDKDTNDLAKLPVATNSGGNLVFTFPRDQDSIDGTTSVAIQVGTDLAAWTNYNVGADTAGSDAGVTVSKDSPAAGTDTVTLSVAMSPDTEKFARLKVTIAP